MIRAMTGPMLELRGVRVHNLKGVDAAIPLGRLTVVTGVSGSGKSSLVFDTLYAEAQRRYLQSFSISSRQFLERFDQPDADWIGDLPPAVAVRAGDSWGRSSATLADITDLADLFAELFTREGVAICPQCGQDVRPHSPADVVRELQALASGTRLTLGFPDRPGEGESPEQWLDRLREEGWVRLKIGDEIHRLGETKTVPLDSTAEPLVVIDRLEIGKATDERRLETIETGFRRGDGRLVATLDAGEMRFDRRWRCPRCDVVVAAPEPRLFDCHDPLGACPECHGAGTLKSTICPACKGHRFNPLALSVRWQNRSLAAINQMPLRDLISLLQSPPSPGTEVLRSPGDRPLQNQIATRLQALIALNLPDLTPGRDLAALASSEAQRLRLHRAIASDLANCLYLFDEPTAGLHPHDVALMLPHLVALRDAGNTLVVIDHHPAVWRIADHVIDLGPGAGDDGGRILHQGSLDDLRAIEESVTAQWLDAGMSPTSSPRPRTHGELRLSGVNIPPLHNLDIAFPLGVLCVVAGVSGAGKTRLLRDALFPAIARAKQKKGFDDPPMGTKLLGAEKIEDAILFDQTPLPRSSRSNPATSLKIFDDIRELFAATTDARIRNFGPGAFSFNQPGGRCETCEGQGRLAVDMQFLPDVTTTCPECLGRRYRKEILAIKVRGVSIAEVLDLTARKAFRFFRAQRALEKKLKWLLDVGLDYVRLGQPLETLSTGEMQRLKLAGHLASSRKPRSLFVLIEPMRGLHPDDVAGLLDCFGQLIATGHSVILEDQNPYVLRQADYLVELEAGRVVARGTPGEIAKLDTPTGRFLATHRSA